MSSHSGLLVLFYIFPLLIISCCAYSWEAKEEKINQSVYETLQWYGFPGGLLPEGVTGYNLNTVTGEFSAYFNGTCIFELANSYLLKYETIVSGEISKGQLRTLRGVSVKAVGFWFRIKEVRRDGDCLVFFVSFSSAKFPVDDFVDSLKCGSGCNCINGVSTGDHVI
ncbi:OLC1v1004320C1 [Oldenlandia corymbosa var. corymbosa]|uniref:OLC1v1004320C1 n=1 Tax=Oldenlandia corymbosa var. corymbosa TaxID=529605 RepID=A0AAV1DF16_OLDCO|nr:OLC1v1004320C1 [Oldenlandia corymbosa var. corymbosa]